MGRDGPGRVHPLQDRLPPNTVSTEETQQSPMLPNTEMVELSSRCEINENSNVLPIQSKKAQLKTSKSNRKAMNRNWSNQKANPVLKTKAVNK